MNPAGNLGSGAAGDPRMRGFKTRTAVADLWSWIAVSIKPLESEEIDLADGSGRVLARQITAAVAVPAFDRSAMDGYAVRALETFGASAYTPATFRRVGRSRPGVRCEAAVGACEMIEIATGAPLPPGADAVVPVESTQLDGDFVLVSESVPQGRNIGRRGEDIAPGTVLLAVGRVLRPQDLGLLSAIGTSRIDVVRRPRVGVVVTGDELLPPGTPARDFQIPDVNSVMIAALVARDGGKCEIVGPLPDDRAIIRHAVVELAQRCDLLLLSGGSSAGPEDHVPGIIAELGTLVAHGLALRPASPTGVGVLNNQGERPVVMLPGNPVSCLCAYDFAAGPILRRLGARQGLWPYRRVSVPLARKLSSVAGRVNYARVRFIDGQAEPIATSGASILSSVSRADGFVVVPAPLEGFPAGARVTVWCYDETCLLAADPLEVHRQEKTGSLDHSIRKRTQTPLG